jgi:hypothetical protein
MDFYLIILIIAAVILVIALAGIGIGIANGKSTTGFPSYINPCPDFWTTSYDPTSKTYTCTANGQNYGTMSDGSTYKPAGVECKDNQWAKDNTVFWDGITNNRDAAACSTTPPAKA